MKMRPTWSDFVLSRRGLFGATVGGSYLHIKHFTAFAFNFFDGMQGAFNRNIIQNVCTTLLLLAALTARADLDETKKEIENRYAKEGQEDSTKTADPPAETVTQYSLGTGSRAGNIAAVWFKDGNREWRCTLGRWA